MHLGLGRASITPDWPVPLAGFSVRQGALSEGVAHEIAIRVALLDDGVSPAVIVSGELLNWSPDTQRRFRRIVSETAQVDPSRVLFSATHTHSAPQSTHSQAECLGVVDPRYVELLADALEQATRQACADPVPVTADRVSQEHQLGRHRRAIPDEWVENPPEPLIDRELTAVRFHSAGRLVAVFTHFACHPVISADRQISGDYLGVATALVEDHRGITVFPLQGCCGDINPQAPVAATVTDAAEYGEQFGRDLLALLGRPGDPVALDRIDCAWELVGLPFQQVPTLSELSAVTEDPGLVGEHARGLLARPERLVDQATLSLQLLSLGPELQLLGIDAEVTTPYGVRIKELTGGSTLPVAYCNGMVGYLPTARQIANGGYEVEDSAMCYLLSSAFDPSVEQRVHRGIDRLLGRSGSSGKALGHGT